MYLYVQSKLGALQFNDVDVSPLDGTYTARGRLPIFLQLIWDERGLFSGRFKACFPGKPGNEISDAVMSAGLESLGTTRCVSSVGVEYVLAPFTPRGGSAALLTCARGRKTQSLIRA